MFGPSDPSSPQRSVWSIAHQNSSSVSPFQAKVGMPALATAAAAWSWVEKMLHEAQRSSAPSATRVSISTAVCTVMWREPVMRAPASGWSPRYSSRRAIRPGISCSARAMSRRPYSARPGSATLKSSLAAVAVLGGVIGGAGSLVVSGRHTGYELRRLGALIVQPTFSSASSSVSLRIFLSPRMPVHSRSSSATASRAIA